MTGSANRLSRRPRARHCLILLATATALGAAGCGPDQPGTTGANSSLTPSSSSGSTDGEGYHSEQTSYQIPGGVTLLRLTGRAGRVTVTAADGPIKVTESVRYSDDKPATSHAVNGDTLELRDEGCQHKRASNGRCEVDWDITAPASTNLNLTTSSGGIALTGSAGTLELRTSSGGVRGRALASKNVAANTSAGGVDLRFAQPPDQVQANSTAGGIDIRVPGGTSYAVDARTSAGQVEIGVPRSDSSPHKIAAKTSAGDIDISTG